MTNNTMNTLQNHTIFLIA